MKVTWRFSASTASALGFGLLMLTLALLGFFVVSLALGSGLAVVLGTGFVVCLAGTVMGFRAASRRLEQAAIFDQPTSPVSIFSTPLSQSERDRYLQHYRGGGSAVARLRGLAVVVGDNATPPEAARLSA